MVQFILLWILKTNFGRQPRQTVPEDGLPLLEDWLTVYEGMTLHGLDLAREPIDVAVPNSEFKFDPVSERDKNSNSH